MSEKTETSNDKIDKSSISASSLCQNHDHVSAATAKTSTTTTINSTSLLTASPVVGQTSRNYSVASDDDDDEIISNNIRYSSDTMSDTILTRHTTMFDNPSINNGGVNGVNTSRNNTANNSNGLYVNDIEHGEEQPQWNGAWLRRPLLTNSHDHDEEDYDDNDDNDMGHYNESLYHHYPGRRNNRYSSSIPLNGLNYLNVMTYIMNVFVSYGIGYGGLFGLLRTRSDILKEYETLVTPAEWAYYLWIPILFFECIFATAQLFPYYRGRPIIQEGTKYFFFLTCIIQTIWTVFFALEWFILSFVAVVVALVSLASLLASQQYTLTQQQHQRQHPYIHSSTTTQRKANRMEYWLFRFPFYIHTGWLIMCSIVQWSMLFSKYTGNTGVQLAADIVALGVMLPPSTFFLTGQPSGPDFVIPLVIIWSYISIGLELNHPTKSIQQLYDHNAIVAIRDASFFFAITVGIMLIPRIVIWLAHECLTINVLELMVNDEEEQENQEYFTVTSPATATANSVGNVNTEFVVLENDDYT